jgi:hypothetical protein
MVSASREDRARISSPCLRAMMGLQRIRWCSTRQEAPVFRDQISAATCGSRVDLELTLTGSGAEVHVRTPCTTLQAKLDLRVGTLRQVSSL